MEAHEGGAAWPPEEEELHRVADQRWGKVLSTGKTVPWDAAKVYLEARAKGEHPYKPVALRRIECAVSTSVGPRGNTS